MRSRHTRVRDLWDREAQDWKNLSNLGMHFHASNQASKDIILKSIPRRPDSFNPRAQPGDWVSSSAPQSGELLDWVYYVTDSLPDKVLALEFKRASASDQLWAISYQVHSLPHTNLSSVRVLSQERHALPSRWPEILFPPTRETEHSGSLKQALLKTFPGIQGSGIGKKFTRSATRPSLATQPKGDTGTPRGPLTPLELSISSMISA